MRKAVVDSSRVAGGGPSTRMAISTTPRRPTGRACRSTSTREFCCTLHGRFKIAKGAALLCGVLRRDRQQGRAIERSAVMHRHGGALGGGMPANGWWGPQVLFREGPWQAEVRRFALINPWTGDALVHSIPLRPVAGLILAIRSAGDPAERSTTARLVGRRVGGRPRCQRVASVVAHRSQRRWPRQRGRRRDRQSAPAGTVRCRPADRLVGIHTAGGRRDGGPGDLAAPGFRCRTGDLGGHRRADRLVLPAACRPLGVGVLRLVPGRGCGGRRHRGLAVGTLRRGARGAVRVGRGIR